MIYDIFFNFPECGFNDGPFHGRTLEVRIDTMQIDDSVDTEFGKYQVSNRSEEQAPILILSEKKETWALELDVSLNKDYSNMFLWKLENLSYDQASKILNFSAHWTFGIERGTIYLGTDGKLDMMCLSW